MEKQLLTDRLRRAIEACKEDKPVIVDGHPVSTIRQERQTKAEVWRGIIDMIDKGESFIGVTLAAQGFINAYSQLVKEGRSTRQDRARLCAWKMVQSNIRDITEGK